MQRPRDTYEDDRSQHDFDKEERRRYGILNFLYNRIPAIFFGIVGVAINHKLKLTSPDKAFAGAFAATEVWRKIREKIVAPRAYARFKNSQKPIQLKSEKSERCRQAIQLGQDIENSWWEYGKSCLYLRKHWRTLNPFDPVFGACQAGRVEAQKNKEEENMKSCSL